MLRRNLVLLTAGDGKLRRATLPRWFQATFTILGLPRPKGVRIPLARLRGQWHEILNHGAPRTVASRWGFEPVLAISRQAVAYPL